MSAKESTGPTKPSDFKEFVRRIVAVPKSELEKQEAAFKRKQAKRRTR